MAKEVFQLEVQVQTNPALTGLNQIDRKLKDVKSSADNLGRSNLKGFSSSVNTLGASLKGLGSTIGALAFGTVTVGAVAAIAAMQNLETVLTTVTGSAGGAAEAMKLLQTVAATTPFSVNQLGESLIKLKAAGLNPTVDQLKLFSDVASVTTDKVGSLQAITDLYARTTAGGLGLEDLNRLADRGIPVFDILSKRIGVSRLQISEFGKSAAGAKIILSNLEAGLSDAFSGASARSLNTLSGQFGVLKKNLESLAVAAGGAGGTAGLTELTKGLNQLTVALKPIAAAFGGAFGDALSLVSKGINELINNTGRFITIIATSIVALLSWKAILITTAAAATAFSKSMALTATGTAAVAAAVAGGSIQATRWEVIGLAIASVTSAIKKFGVAIIAAFSGGIIGAISKLTATIVASPIIGWVTRTAAAFGLFNPVGAIIATVVSTLVLFRNATVSVGDASASVSEIVSYAFKKIGDGIIYPFEQIGKLVTRLGELAMMIPGVSTAATAIGQAWSAAGNLASGAWDWVKENTIGGVVREIDAARAALPATTGSGRGSGAAQLADYNTRTKKEREEINAILTGSDQILSKIINSIKQETALIGLSKQASEEQNAILSAQAQIREKLLAGSKMTESEADAEAASQVAKRAGEIRSAIATKYQTESRVFFVEMVKAGNTEISQLTMSNNERERANQLKEIQVNLGMTDAMWSKEKSKYEAEIARTQAARVNDSLNKSLEGINKETEYLKLSNKEREIRIALDQAAADAGLKNAGDLDKVRAAEIRSAVINRQMTTVDVAGEQQITQMQEELGLMRILDTRTREYTKTRNDLYKAIDPEGRGANITNAQKAQIEGLLLATEQAQALLDINKKIEDSYASLGSAVSNWAMGGENAIKQVRLELVKLLAMQAFKTFAGGMPTGATGSFISGVIGGLSGARENGGPVSAGKSYLVGEKRPEVFVPQTNGYIVPNVAMMSTRTGATNVTLSPNLIIQGSVTGQTELENMFDQFASAMAQETQQFVINQRGQNGILAR